MRTMNRLTALQVQRLLKKPGLHADGGNLNLQVKRSARGRGYFGTSAMASRNFWALGRRAM